MDNSEILESGRNSIRTQLESLKKLDKAVNEIFLDVVHLLYNMKGRLIVTGIGKSALVGQKIVATMNSTGTPALFMHAADAIHGDLGMLREGDVVMCISKSGETSEIKVLVPLIQQLGQKLIAITSGENSFLATKSDYSLITPMVKEADPNNLAPTTSTTLQMVLGDAIAICLLQMRGFSSSDFARYHPGGSLGKKLYLRVSDLIIRNEIPRVSPDDNVRKIIYEISGKMMGATAVIDSGALIGIITDGDLRRMLENNDNTDGITAVDIMSKDPLTIQKDEYAINSLNMMRSNNISQLIVMGDETYLGMIHLHDLLREGIV